MEVVEEVEVEEEQVEVEQEVVAAEEEAAVEEEEVEAHQAGHRQLLVIPAARPG